MKFHNMLPFRRVPLVIAVLGMHVSTARGLSQKYCSTQNTGSSYGAVSDIYQSNGNCHDQCSSDYAFAIVQWQKCWCSNYIPADQSDTSNCNQNCPGYPEDQCGNSKDGYFGYIALNKAPEGTAGAVAAASSTNSPTSPSSTAQSSTSPEDPETSYIQTSSSAEPSTSSAISSSSSSTTHLPTHIIPVVPVTSVILKTISGAIVTQTVTSTPLVAPGPHSDSVQMVRKDGLGAGAVAGIVIGVLAGLAALALAGFLLWRRKRNNIDDEKAGSGSLGGVKKNPTRNTSVLSKAGLLARTRPSMSDNPSDDYVSPTGANSVRHSMLLNGASAVDTAGPLESSHSGGSRRMSKPMVYDQRLNPSALFANPDANGSRVSMQDTQDYSRPLGVMNPDPRASFDSRFSRA